MARTSYPELLQVIDHEGHCSEGGGRSWGQMATWSGKEAAWCIQKGENATHMEPSVYVRQTQASLCCPAVNDIHSSCLHPWHCPLIIVMPAWMSLSIRKWAVPCDDSIEFADSLFPLFYGPGESWFVNWFKGEWMTKAPFHNGLSGRGSGGLSVTSCWSCVCLLLIDVSMSTSQWWQGNTCHHSLKPLFCQMCSPKFTSYDPCKPLMWILAGTGYTTNHECR